MACYMVKSESFTKPLISEAKQEYPYYHNYSVHCWEVNPSKSK